MNSSDSLLNTDDEGVDGVRVGNRLPGAVQKYRAFRRLLNIRKKTYEPPDDNIITDGAKRFRRVEVFFQPVLLAADSSTLLHHEV